MKKFIPIIGLFVIATFVLSACTQQPTTVDPAPVNPEPIDPAPVDPAPEEPATVDVEELVLEKIQGEHTLEFVLKEKRTADEWSEVLDRMIGYGADINEEEKTLIIEWLLERQK